MFNFSNTSAFGATSTPAKRKSDVVIASNWVMFVMGILSFNELHSSFQWICLNLNLSIRCGDNHGKHWLRCATKFWSNFSLWIDWWILTLFFHTMRELINSSWIIGFGTPAVSSAPSFGGFGTTAMAASAAPTGFSFAQPATAQPSGLGTFGQSAPPSTGFGLGSAFGNAPATLTTSGSCEIKSISNWFSIGYVCSSRASIWWVRHWIGIRRDKYGNNICIFIQYAGVWCPNGRRTIGVRWLWFM